MLYDKRWELDAAGKLILEAADYLKHHEWVQGRLCTPDGGACIMGALDRGSDPDITIAAIRRVNAYLWWKRKWPDMMIFNDVPWRKKEHVIAALHEAAYFQKGW